LIWAMEGRGIMRTQAIYNAVSRLLKFCFLQPYPAFETGSVVLVECH